MAGIVQRALNSSSNNDDILLSDNDKEMLFQSIQELDTKIKEESPKNEFIS
jgi:hypothetical protein